MQAPLPFLPLTPAPHMSSAAMQSRICKRSYRHSEGQERPLIPLGALVPVRRRGAEVGKYIPTGLNTSVLKSLALPRMGCEEGALGVPWLPPAFLPFAHLPPPSLLSSSL